MCRWFDFGNIKLAQLLDVTKHVAELRGKVAQGLASAKAGKLADSDTVIARLHSRLDKLEKDRRRT